jgi:hypothetical protein
MAELRLASEDEYATGSGAAGLERVAARLALLTVLLSSLSEVG